MVLLAAALVVAVALVVAAVLVRRLFRASDASASLPVLEAELRALGARLVMMEQHDSALRDAVAGLGGQLSSTAAVTGGVRETAERIRGDLARARESLVQIEAAATERGRVERANADALRRLELLMTGSASRGAAGEHVVAAALAKLPSEWQVRDFRVGNKVVEFGLRLPNGLVLPIDSKWPAAALLERALETEDPVERDRCVDELDAVVRAKAQEVTRYLDPGRTAGIAVAVVPDALYDLCHRARLDALRHHVVLVGYSMFVPYLLLAFQMALGATDALDRRRSAAYLETARRSIEGMEAELEGRFARALVMLGNSRDEIRVHTSRMAESLTAVRVRDSDEPPRLIDS